jgi:HK97 family phage portal protein
MGFLSRRTEKRDWSISDPALADWLGVGARSYSGVSVGEYSALSVPAIWRGVSLIAGTVASLPLKSYRDLPDGSRERVKSFLDNPAGIEAQTPYEWTETVVAHLVLHGNAFLLHQYGGAGQLMGLRPLHPGCVSVALDANAPGGKVFRVSMADGTTRDFTGVDLTHIPGLATDPSGRGLSLIEIARNSIGMTIAADQSASRLFGNGMLLSGIVTPEDDLTEDEARQVKESLQRKMLGHEHAGDVAVINRRLKFEPWSMNNTDAQWIEARGFQVDEVARLLGVPKVLLMEDGASTWGSGIAELVSGWVRFSLAGWTARIEQRLSRLLPSPRFCEFDYAGLLKPTPADEINLLIAQVNNGLVTVNEARRIRNMEPVPGGDTLRLPPGSPPQDQPDSGAEQEINA